MVIEPELVPVLVVKTKSVAPVVVIPAAPPPTLMYPETYKFAPSKVKFDDPVIESAASPNAT